MAISASSKILASDVSGKIDTAGTGLTKSGTTLSLASLHSAASTIGSSSAQTLAYSGTFTIPYIKRDVYGRVSGGGTRTITMPAASSGYPQICYARGKLTIPNGGTWMWVRLGDGGSSYAEVSSCAGGTTHEQGTYYFFAIRYA